MAARLGKTVQETQKTVTSTEFFEWLEFDTWELEQNNTKLDYYLAAILAELRRSWVDKPASVRDVDHLLKFSKSSDSSPRSSALTEQAMIDAMSDEEYEKWRKEKMERSKAAWGAYIFTNPTQKPPPTP